MLIFGQKLIETRWGQIAPQPLFRRISANRRGWPATHSRTHASTATGCSATRCSESRPISAFKHKQQECRLKFEVAVSVCRAAIRHRTAFERVPHIPLRYPRATWVLRLLDRCHWSRVCVFPCSHRLCVHLKVGLALKMQFVA